MGSFTHAFILLLIGINAANATDELSHSILVKQLNYNAAATTGKAANLTGQVRDIVKKSNDEINYILKIFRKIVGSAVEEAVSFAAHELAPEDAPECLADSKEDVAKLIGLTVEELSKCVSTPYTSITKSIEDLVVAGDKATKAANSYVKRIEECNDSGDKAYCFADMLFNVQRTVAELVVATSEEVTNIGSTIAGLEDIIDSCTTETVILAFIKGVAIGFEVSRCNMEALDE